MSRCAFNVNTAGKQTDGHGQHGEEEDRLETRSEKMDPADIRRLGVGCLAGAVYELTGERRDTRRFPVQGQLVDAGGIRLNINCTGQGAIPVILENGMGIPGAGWSQVQSEVEKFTRVCSYDRAGCGWSDPGPLPRTSLQIAKELHTLLHNAGESPYYILVGHSFGAFTVRAFNGLYPDEVAGMVLVAPELEDEHAILTAHHFITPADDKKQARVDTTLAALYPVLRRIGVARLLISSQHSGLPEPIESQLYSLILRPNHIPAMLHEDLSDQESAQQMRQSGNLGNKPLVVLTPASGNRNPEVSQQDWDIYVADTTALQHKLAALSTQGQQVTVGTAHELQFEKPEAVTNAIRQVFQLASAGR
jgi:pimeloyl-ACP methyl ester carboxylesterase